MSRSMDDDFTYFVKILDDNDDRYYLKSSIDERTNTILIQLTNLKSGWIGTCKFYLLENNFLEKDFFFFVF